MMSTAFDSDGKSRPGSAPGVSAEASALFPTPQPSSLNTRLWGVQARCEPRSTLSATSGAVTEESSGIREEQGVGFKDTKASSTGRTQ